MMPLPISTPVAILDAFEAIAAFAGLIYWKKVKNNYFKWLSIYLIYIFLADFSGPIIDSLGINNTKYYNYFVIPEEFLFFFCLFHKNFEKSEYKGLPILCMGIYFISLMADVFYFSKHQFFFDSISYSIGNLLLLILILLFFIQLINNDEVLTFQKNMMFWICVGLLVYFLGSFPYYGLRNTFIAKYHNLHEIYYYITNALDCFMYLMFTFSFIWGKPNLKSSQSSSA